MNSRAFFVGFVAMLAFAGLAFVWSADGFEPFDRAIATLLISGIAGMALIAIRETP